MSNEKYTNIKTNILKIVAVNHSLSTNNDTTIILNTGSKNTDKKNRLPHRLRRQTSMTPLQMDTGNRNQKYFHSILNHV